MGRKRRVWYPGAEYHVINRGNRKESLFKDKDDFEIYLQLLAKTKKRYPFYLLSYCLMTNHLHLQIRTIDDKLYPIIQYVHSNYSRYFNNRHNYVGHLFQGRYVAKLIEEEAHSLVTSRYIHLNPVKAKMVKSPRDYQWSSYCSMITKEQNKFVDVERELILKHFALDPERMYEEFVESSEVSGTVKE